MKLAVYKYPWNFIRETPSHTGLPPHTFILLELCTILEKSNKVRDDVKTIYVAELDKMDIVEGIHHASKILEKNTIQVIKDWNRQQFRQHILFQANIIQHEITKKKLPIQIPWLIQS